MAEVARGPVWRVELDDLPAQTAGLHGERRHEAVHGLGVFEVAQQLAAARAGRRCASPAAGLRSMGAVLQRRHAVPTDARSRRARSAMPRSVGTRRGRRSMGMRPARRIASRRATSREARSSETPSSPARWARVIQGQSKITSRQRFPARLSSGRCKRCGSPGRKGRGRSARAGGDSAGARPCRSIAESASPRVRTPEREGSRQMRSPGPAETTCSSRARKAVSGSAPQEPSHVPQAHLVRQEQEERAGEGTLVRAGAGAWRRRCGR